MNFAEIPVVFSCAEEAMVGIVALPAQHGSCGVVIVVGGPQCRTGSHRQFTLLARTLANHGIPSIRFDYRGMGDSDGEMRTFETVNEDVKLAADTLLKHVPGITETVLWGLCDGASASLLYANKDKRVTGLVLVNPWVRTPETLAKAEIRHYYKGRLTSVAFWKKLFTGHVNLVSSLKDGLRSLYGAFGHTEKVARADASMTLPQKMLQCASAFRGRVLLLQSGQDLTAREFDDLLRSDDGWKLWAGGHLVTRVDIPDADHTFSEPACLARAEAETISWVQSC